MIALLLIAGLILGGIVGEVGGALGGAALGLALGSYLQLKRRIDELEQELERRPLARWNDEPQIPPRAQPPATPAWTREPEPAQEAAPAPEAEPVITPQGEPEQERASTFIPYPEPVPALQPRYAPSSATGSVPDGALETPWRSTAPNLGDSGPVRWVRDYFMNGNLVVRVGIIVLFFGVAFLLKFAADRHMLPVELRLAGVAAGGAALLIIGWRLRERQRMYALALQGGGVGLLYFTVFAALRLYALLPPTVCFALLVAIAGLSAFLAIGQNSVALAALGATGGFLAPVLASTGQGNHVVLFSYYALLDAGIVAIAWFKAWRTLNLLAFAFTYGIGTGWGVLRYSPENFATTEPFLLLFFVMFLAVAVLFALRRPPKLHDYVDGTLVFGTPVFTMVLQAGLVHGREYALAFSALGFGAVYLAMAALIWRRRGEELRLLAEAFLALGVAFITLAVPLALNGHWTAATWALEGAAIFWVGMRQKRMLAICSGLLLQVGAAVAFVARHDVSSEAQPLVGSVFVGALLISLGGFVVARVLHQHRERLNEEARRLMPVPVYWSLAWWFFAWLHEIHDFVAAEHQWPAFLLLCTATALGCAALSRWNEWRELRSPTLLPLPAMVITAIFMIADGHLLASSGALAWPLAVLAWFWLLRWRGGDSDSFVDTCAHVATGWLLAGLATFEFAWQLEHLRLGDPVWHDVVWGLVPAAVLALLLLVPARQRWPIAAFPQAYLRVVPAGLAIYLAIWLLYACSFDGSAAPLPYLPIANPADIAQGLVLASLLNWLLFLGRERDQGFDEALDAAPWAMVALGFIVLNAALLRALHHLGDVAYEPGAMAGSTLVQAALSIFWGLLSLGTMVFATQRGQRVIWFAGAALLGVVLVKMFLVDLSQVRSVARIVSFIGVGVLMLVIGRYSPLPPAVKAEGVA